jgi:ribonuclease D
LDVTPRFVLSDLGVVSVASSSPNSVDDLRRLRGVDGRAMKSGVADELMLILAESKGRTPEPKSLDKSPEMPADLRPVVPLIAAWANQQARSLELEASMLATRGDLEDLLRGVPGSRLATGWRAEIVGEPIRRLVEGEAALAFHKGEGLVLVDDPGDTTAD